jgi:predicted transcriptional regulator of viral defense system
MTNSERLKILVDSGKTVFRPGDLRVLWRMKPLNAKVSARRMVERGLLLKITWGYYALRSTYDVCELANSIISPSYVSFNTALFRAGVNFQQRGSVDSVATIGYRKTVQGRQFAYYAMKDTLFFNLEGVLTRDNLAIATPERAILDALYFGLLPDIDDPDKIDRKYLKDLSGLYPATVRQKARRFHES